MDCTNSTFTEDSGSIPVKGFSEKELPGHGGLAQVYRGTLPDSKLQVAVKRISNESRQGLREFVSEIASIGKLPHRNLVQLQGWCRRKDDFLLVNDYLSNGRLSDFGLARLYEHESNPGTTRVVGTLGYLAPETPRTGKATASSDVFAYGAFLLEVVCGRRPIEPGASTEELVLVDWVWEKYREGRVLDVVDHKMNGEYNETEVVMVVKLGIICSNNSPAARPSIRQVLKYLDGEVGLPENVWPPSGVYDAGKGDTEEFDAFLHSFASSSFDKMSSSYSFMENGNLHTTFESLSLHPDRGVR